jgi:transposase
MGISRRSPEEKKQIIKEAVETGNSSLVARKHNVTPSAVARWVKEYKPDPMKEMTNKALKKIPGLNESLKEAKQIEEQNLKLKKLIGEKELEIDILRDLLKKTKIQLPPR